MISDDAVVHELDLPAPPAQVFAMFTEPDQLIRWIGLSAQLDPRPGGQFRFEVAPGQFCEGEYVVVEPHQRLVLTWGWTDPSMGVPPGSSRVEVTLEPAATGTHLRLVHDGLLGEMRLLHDDGWTRFLERLASVMQGREMPLYPDEDPEQRLARLRKEEAGP